MTEIKSLTFENLKKTLSDMGEPAYRAKQIFSWLHKGVESFDEMTNLSKALRQKLSESFLLTVPKAVRKQVSQMDGTIKYLWKLKDSSCIETVLMKYKHGNTVCISCQVGCRMGCAFCASTIGGLVRNLTAGEMLDQVIFTQKDSGEKISNIVLMGIGEPLDNFDTVIDFLKLVNHAEGINIGMRHISLSTSGITEKIDKLSDYNLQLTLSVSLHALDNVKRSELMPVNRKWDVDELFNACDRYYDKTGRRISYEYAMIDGVNDTDKDLELLIERLKERPGSHVNLIPLNEVEGSKMHPSKKDRIYAFKKGLEENNIAVSIRRKLGSDITASCGQLRRQNSIPQYGNYDVGTI